MRSSIFAFGTDLLGEGEDTVLANVHDRAGAEAVAFSVNYHNARDVFPHNPRHKVYRHEGDIAWFRPESGRYRSGLLPYLSSEAEGRDLLESLCTKADRRGIPVDAWTIFLHNSRLADAFPDCATRNVYGDPYLTDLCPANPRVRDYCRELAGDLSRYPLQRLLAESLHYRPLEHGEHHERYFIQLSPSARMLLSLCFCTHCRARASSAGVEVDLLAGAIRDALEPVWSEGPELKLSADLRQQLNLYVEMRTVVVTSLAAELHDVTAAAGIRLAFMDHAGAMPHVMLGVGLGDDVNVLARGLGINPATVSQAVDEYVVLGYVDTAARLQSMLDSYTAVLDGHVSVSVALRPLRTDCSAASNLREKVAALRVAETASVDFYHYGLMPLDRLDWIRSAMSPSGEGTGSFEQSAPR